MTTSMKLAIPTFVTVLSLLQCYSLPAQVPSSIRPKRFWDRTTIVLINRVDDVLTLHCKSKDDVLGVHILQKGESWEFSFDPNFFFRTLFYCSFQWDGETHYFDVYKQTRDYRYKKIWWQVKIDGVCSRVTEGLFCFPWN
ncbi:hypothetical protein MLD38_035050 [Melastoma candidum]|uniref:Uncharacterized protein n=1 Tax=Melastoma candidum TaxID=119954 RepID=A0ACB9MBZ6_9MYRT|nr:hypothetical protein MLD38_035050 [Melastoma candidum]